MPGPPRPTPLDSVGPTWHTFTWVDPVICYEDSRPGRIGAHDRASGLSLRDSHEKMVEMVAVSQVWSLWDTCLTLMVTVQVLSLFLMDPTSR